MSNALPRGWATTSLSELVTDLESGSRPRGGVRGIAEGVPSIGGEHLNYNGGFNFDSIKYVPRDFAAAMTKGRIRHNDILVVKDGATTGKTAFVDSRFPFADAFVNEHVFICRPNREIEPRFLFNFLISKEGQERILENFKGSAQGGINQSFSPNTEVPLAPLAEQQRIVAKLEKLLGKADACQQRLAKIPSLLKRFRQAVLAAACSGRLTADWREKNPDTEPYAATIEHGVELDEEFPRNWGVVRLGALAAFVTSGSRGWAKYYAESGSIFVRAQNINSDFLNLDDIAFVRPPVSAEGLRTKVKQHDLLITITGANVTKSALVEKPIEDAYVSQHVALVRLKDIRISEFLFHSVVSLAHGRKQLQAAAYGQGKPGLNLDNIRGVVVGLPPLPEQKEIGRRVERLFTLADRIESRFEEGRKRVDSITQAILAKAFRGELVPTEFELAKAEGRSFESAEELLARIERNGQIEEEGEKKSKSRRLRSSTGLLQSAV